MKHEHPHRPITLLRALIASLGELMRRLWRAHLRLLRSNAAYAAAVAAGLAAIASQDNLLDMAAAIAATVLAVYSALRRRPAHQ